MNRFVAQAVALAFLAGCGGPPAVPALQPAPAPAPTGCLRADLPRLVPVARFQLPGKHHRFSGRSVQVSADGTRVALGSDFPANGSLTQVWQLAPRPNVLFTSPTCYSGASFALSPSGERLITSSTGSPEAFDVNAGESLGKLLDTNQFCDAFLRDDGVAVWAVRSYERSKLSKGKVFVWDVVKNADAGTFEIADNRFSDAFPARNGAELWLFRYVGRFEVECYNVKTKKLARSIHPES